MQESLEKLDIQLSLELWYTEHGFGLASGGISPTSGGSSTGTGSGAGSTNNNNGSGLNGSSSNNVECVSSRVLNLNLKPTRGLHYNLPVLFDYFHLSAVSLTIHAVLISLHQPYIK